uniref:Secreted protein n=1 Tax=Arundo donax TaxID=35708 RepID=A0A0A9GEU4_ARUDO
MASGGLHGLWYLYLESFRQLFSCLILSCSAMQLGISPASRGTPGGPWRLLGDPQQNASRVRAPSGSLCAMTWISPPGSFVMGSVPALGSLDKAKVAV